MVLRLTSRSPRRPDFVVTVVSRIKVLSAPGRADLPPQNLTPALGRQNHTTSPSASAPFVCAPFDRSRAQHPPCDHLLRAGLPRPPHPIPNVRDDRETPLCGPGRFGYASDLGQRRSEIFLQMGLDKPFRKTRSDLPVGHNQLDPVQTNSNFPQAAACCRAASPAVHRGYGPRINRP
jgi:hypothetical protein